MSSMQSAPAAIPATSVIASVAGFAPADRAEHSRIHADRPRHPDLSLTSGQRAAPAWRR